MRKLMFLGLLVLAVGGAILLFGPDGVVSKCPLSAASGVVASRCSDAIEEQEKEESGVRDVATLITAAGALLTGIGALRKRAP